MADINHIISLGIGTPGAVPEFLTLGLQIGEADTDFISFTVYGPSASMIVKGPQDSMTVYGPSDSMIVKGGL